MWQEHRNFWCEISFLKLTVVIFLLPVTTMFK